MAEKVEKMESSEIKPIDVKTILSGYNPGREEYFAAIGHLLREAAAKNAVLDEEIKQMEGIAKKLHDSHDFKSRSRPVIAATIFWWVTSKSPNAKKFWKQIEIAKLFGVSEMIMRRVLHINKKFISDDGEQEV